MFFFGALTLKNYAFQLRAWEVTLTENLDITDSFFSPISFDLRGGLLRRVLPKNNIWISNTTRFGYDGLVLNRISIPYVLWSEHTTSFCSFFLNLVPVSWSFLFNHLSFFLQFKQPISIFGSGSLLSIDQLSLAKYFLSNISSFLTLNELGLPVMSGNFRNFYLTRTLLSQFYLFNSFALIAVNLRLESPLILTQLRKYLQIPISSFLHQGSHKQLFTKFCFSFITKPWLLQNDIFFGGSFSSLFQFFFGKHFFCRLVKFPIVFIFGGSFISSVNVLRFFLQKYTDCKLQVHFFNLTYFPSFFNILLVNFSFSNFGGNNSNLEFSMRYVPSLMFNYMASNSIFVTIKPFVYFWIINLFFSNILYYFVYVSYYDFFTIFVLLFDTFGEFYVLNNLFFLSHVFNLQYLRLIFYYVKLITKATVSNKFSIFLSSHAFNLINLSLFSQIMPIRSFGETSFNFMNNFGFVGASNIFRKSVRLSLNDQSIFFLIYLHLFYYNYSFHTKASFFFTYFKQLSLDFWNTGSFCLFYKQFFLYYPLFFSVMDNHVFFLFKLKYVRSVLSELTSNVLKIWYNPLNYTLTSRFV